MRRGSISAPRPSPPPAGASSIGRAVARGLADDLPGRGVVRRDDAARPRGRRRTRDVLRRGIARGLRADAGAPAASSTRTTHAPAWTTPRALAGATVDRDDPAARPPPDRRAHRDRPRDRAAGSARVRRARGQRRAERRGRVAADAAARGPAKQAARGRGHLHGDRRDRLAPGCRPVHGRAAAVRVPRRRRRDRLFYSLGAHAEDRAAQVGAALGVAGLWISVVGSDHSDVQLSCSPAG